MKQIMMVVALMLTIGYSGAAQKTETEIKKTSSPTQKVHNVFSKHKRHNGYKIKTKRNGHKIVKKVNTQTGEVKIKKD